MEWGLTHGCKGVPQVFLVDNAITVLIDYREGLWRAGTGRVYRPCFSIPTPNRSDSGSLPVVLLHSEQGGEQGTLNPSPPPPNRCTFQGGGGGKEGQQGVLLVSLQSPFCLHSPP